MSAITVAPLASPQLTEWQRLLRQAFFQRWGYPYTRPRFFLDYITNDPHHRVGSIWGLTADGQLASTFQIFSRQLRYKGSAFQLDGLGNIGTLPACQRRGYAKALLQWYLEHKQPRPDIIMLYSSTGTIYKTLGWQPATASEYVLRKPVLQGFTPHAHRITARPIQIHDLRAVSRIYSLFNRAQALPHLFRSAAYWKNWIFNFKLKVYGLQGWLVFARAKPIGYVFLRTKGGRMDIDEYASNPANYEQVFQALLQIFSSSSAQQLNFTRTSPALNHFLKVNSVQFEALARSDETGHTLILNPALRACGANIGLWHVDHF